ncbi:MAG TPA: hypothetical protein VMN57_15670 [Anaerolineales bacterium]|nr:hypothetical protein [Anaerolineales bacterium]
MKAFHLLKCLDAPTPMLYDFLLLLRNPHLRTRTLRTWLGWTAATALGWAAAGLTGLPIGRVVLVEGGSAAILNVAASMGLIGALIGALIGVGQWLYLRRRMRNAAAWLLATAAGWGLGLPLALTVNLFLGLGISAGMYGMFVGGAVGMLQGLAAREVVRRFPHWLVANLLAYVLGISAAGTFERTMLTATGGTWGAAIWEPAISAGLAGLIAGLVTGITFTVFRLDTGRPDDLA